MRKIVVWSALAPLVLSACGKHAEPTRANPSASAPISSSSAKPITASTASAPAGSARLAQPKPQCRALAVTGKASTDGAPITVGSLMDGEHWVELDAGAVVSLRHTLTSRELRLLGPGRVLPCWHGLEQVLLAEGRLSTFSNLGVRPGAEVLIATPTGTVHYGDAALDLQYTEAGLRLRVKDGEAWLEPQEPGPKPRKNPLRNPTEAALPASKLGAATLADACRLSAEAAAESARRILQPDSTAAPGTIGARAAAQMRSRAAARAACATAAAATGTIADPAERQSLWASIAHSDEVWQSVPRAVSAQKN